MTPRVNDNAAHAAVEVLMLNGIEGLAGAVEILLKAFIRENNSQNRTGLSFPLSKIPRFFKLPQLSSFFETPNDSSSRFQTLRQY